MASEVTKRVTDWRQSQVIVNDVVTYAEFIVSVQAANSVGRAPNSTVERRVGHSGEDGIGSAAFVQCRSSLVGSIVGACNIRLR